MIELSRARTQTPASTYVPPVSSTPTTSPQPQASSPAPQTQTTPVSPDQVRFTTTAQVPSDGKGTITLFFTLENRGARTLAADPGRLVITQGATDFPTASSESP